MFKILTLNNISVAGLARLPADRYTVGNEINEPDAVLVRSADMHAFALPASVRAIARAGAGVNNIPIAAMSAKGIPVFNAPGANANAVKELVLAGMLMAARNLDQALSFVGTLAHDGDLHKTVEAKKKNFVGFELAGRTLGVIGLGAIGVKVANAARALGMHVIGFDPHMTVEGAWRLSSEVQKAASLNELYAHSDFISFHVPLNPGTKGMFGADALNHLKTGAVLLNFSREGVIASDVLAAGLADGRIDRYVTDFPAHEWIGHPRVIATPHLGASTNEAEENCAFMVVDQLRAFLEQGNINNAVNFPETQMQRAGLQRVCVANQNRPNMIGQLSHVMGEAGLNIAQMHNASRGDLAYNLIDVDSPVSPAVIGQIAGIEGILSVRIV